MLIAGTQRREPSHSAHFRTSSSCCARRHQWSPEDRPSTNPDCAVQSRCGAGYQISEQPLQNRKVRPQSRQQPDPFLSAPPRSELRERHHIVALKKPPNPAVAGYDTAQPCAIPDAKHHQVSRKMSETLHPALSESRQIRHVGRVYLGLWWQLSLHILSLIHI